MTRLLEEIKQYQSEFRQKAPAEKQRLMAEATADSLLLVSLKV